MPLARLRALLGSFEAVAVAVSGGIDSLTLATVAHRTLGSQARMHHATSPAVPAVATTRTRALAEREGWELDVFDAGEFADERYRANPVDRCFFCKTNLYGAVAARTARAILSGTNTDDLGEYRPGLQAAEHHGVRHPYVEAGIDKAEVRRLAAALGLGTLAELPSAPCLSSRIETGIRIEAPVLAMVHAAETLVGEALAATGPAPRAVRCRVRANGIVIEIDAASLAALDASAQDALARRLAALGLPGLVRFAPYRNGSAFLHTDAGRATT